MVWSIFDGVMAKKILSGFCGYLATRDSSFWCGGRSVSGIRLYGVVTVCRPRKFARRAILIVVQ